MSAVTHSYLKKCAQEGREAVMSAEAGPMEGSVLHGVCPVDLVPWEPVPITSDAAVSDAVASSRLAAEEWTRRSLPDRQKILEKAARSLLEDRGQIVDLVRTEMGKLEVDALFSEGLGPLEVLKGWARVVERATARERIRLNPLSFPRKKAYIDLRPRGVVGVIAPWNFPVAGLYRSVYPALLTGNGVVVKPSEYTPRSSAWFLEHLQAVLPQGLVGIVQGGGATGATLIRSGVDAVVFTGSAATGRKVAVAAAEEGIPASLEMGGNDAAVVLEDADLDRTTAGLTQWALQNSGQACGAIEVVYADRRIADRLVARLAHAFSSLRAGPGPMAEVDVSPVAHAAQLASIEAHVEDARAKGGEVVSGGRRTGE
ncbi:MAG: aldehyde dehydrogenase family protein, partial [Myxococcota bacterium]